MTVHASKNPLETEVQYLKGVGPVRAAAFQTAGIYTFADLLEFQPRRYLDHSQIRSIAEIQPDEEVTVIGTVVELKRISRGKRRLIVRIADSGGMLEAVWFNQVDLFSKIFHTDQLVALSGKVGFYRGWQMVHPDFDILSEQKEALHTGQLIPIYPSGQEFKKAGISNYAIRRIFSEAFRKYGQLIPETLPEHLIQKYRLLSRAEAYRQMHFPSSPEMLHQVQRRFKYEELFYLELLMALRKFHFYSPVQGLPINIDEKQVQQFTASLPFQLTGAQQRVLREIWSDLVKGHPMNRLVQGDVGSGKTIVALLTMQMAIQTGYQAVLMAPTEILAQQHYLNISNLLPEDQYRIELLIGSLQKKEKNRIQQRIARGEAQLVVGTHALIQEKVAFANLGVVVIDEQHRFGVMQRGDLIEKGSSPHVLVMTATPIPRTLSLTIYGDLDVSVIDEMPPGRRPIITKWRTEAQLSKVHDFIRRELNEGAQAYFVYPLVEESEKMDLKAATEAFNHLQKKVFPEFRLALIHGRMKMAEKEKTMAAFKAGEINLLVSTTVIEVGVDVPNAAIMVIEHAERFGLSQLHQLRGRVGRGSKQSYCILITPNDISEVAQQRMHIMTQTNDGFRIAEEDLRIRGSGEFFGIRQHGLPDLKYADLVTDQRIIQVARKDAFALVAADPHLRDKHHQLVLQHFKSRYSDKFRLPSIA